MYHLIFVILFVSVNCHPRPWIHIQIEDGNPLQNNLDVLNPINYGDVQDIRRVGRTLGIINLVGNTLMKGVNYFDQAIPTLRQPPVIHVDTEKLQEERNFTRSRRHEGDLQNIENMTEIENNLIHDDRRISLMNDDFENDIFGTKSPVISTTTDMTTTTTKPTTTKPTITPMTTIMTTTMNQLNELHEEEVELRKLITELNHALDIIKAKDNLNILPTITAINENSSTEDIVQYISTSVDMVMKMRSGPEKTQRINDITTAVNTLFNRIARTVKLHMMHSNVTAVNTTETMLRIAQYLSDAQKEVIAAKIKETAELNGHEMRRPTRQDDDENEVNASNENGNKSPETTTLKPLDVTVIRQDEEGQGASSSQEDGGGNLVASLISSFLGSLSKPDGGVDVDAIVGLVGGLSVQRDDGTYDFTGLTELLQTFLGGDTEAGGSDIGAFLGGLLGAVLQGSANPPGAVGTGRLTGNLIANLLPGLSGPPPPSSSEEEAGNVPPMGKDSGSFLAGLLSSVLGSSSSTSGSGSAGLSGSSSGGSSGGMKPAGAPGDAGSGGSGSGEGSAGFFNMIKNGLFRSVFSIITSLVSSSSGSSSGSSSAPHGTQPQHN